MAKISACIISYNEEKKIEDCLRSLQAVVDEIIIIDSNSTDKTLEIAKRYTDKIFLHDFQGYGKQKNLATNKTANNWVINLDCDERLSSELQSSIKSITNNLDDDTVYSMARKTFYIYRWLNHCWYPDRKIRLFNKTKTRWLDNDVHESVDTSNMRTITLSGDILHYSFDSISDHLKTIDKFTQIGANDLLKKGKNISVISPITHASWTFFKLYIFKRGFLDGFAGLTVSVLSYMHVFIKYSRAYILQKSQREDPRS
ncbi:MAG: glycosyltransferase family 2 protein [Gammaproteobacteria bacterium]|nr:glycosyltransferase family 2 protein [Gammaproteobacteria bacterium]